MLTKIIGFISILWGVFCLVRPEVLRDRLLWKTGRYLFWLAMGVLFYPLIHFGKRWGVAGVLAVLSGLWAGRKIMHTTLRDAFVRIPLVAFRAVGFLSAVSGSLLVWWPKK
jgi:hypothetical protein